MNTKLARYRAKKLEITDREIAEYLGVSRSTVTKWFTGENDIPGKQVLPLAGLLGLSADDLLRDAPRQGAA